MVSRNTFCSFSHGVDDHAGGDGQRQSMGSITTTGASLRSREGEEGEGGMGRRGGTNTPSLETHNLIVASRGGWLIKGYLAHEKSTPLRHYSRTMPVGLCCSWEVGVLL